MANLNNNELMTAILSYLSILVLIPFFAIPEKDRNDFIKFHLEQGINLFIIELIWGIIATILANIFTMMPIIGILLGLIISLIDIAFLIISIIAIIKALNKEKWVIPVIGNIKIYKM